MPSLPPKGARIVFFSIWACSARASALTVLTWASSASSCALVEAPPASRRRVRVTEVVAKSRRACSDDSCAPFDAGVQLDQHLAGAHLRARLEADGAHDAGDLGADRDAATGRDAAHRLEQRLPFGPLATAVPTAWGGGPAACAALPKRIKDEICANFVPASTPITASEIPAAMRIRMRFEMPRPTVWSREGFVSLGSSFDVTARSS